MNGWYRELEATVTELSERLGHALRRIEVLENQARPVVMVEKAALLHAPVLDSNPLRKESMTKMVDEWVTKRMEKKQRGRPKKEEAMING
jgi:hypothetical protein